MGNLKLISTILALLIFGNLAMAQDRRDGARPVAGQAALAS
jgi:hypothetical protein